MGILWEPLWGLLGVWNCAGPGCPLGPRGPRLIILVNMFEFKGVRNWASVGGLVGPMGHGDPPGALVGLLGVWNSPWPGVPLGPRAPRFRILVAMFVFQDSATSGSLGGLGSPMGHGDPLGALGPWGSPGVWNSLGSAWGVSEGSGIPWAPGGLEFLCRVDGRSVVVLAPLLTPTQKC